MLTVLVDSVRRWGDFALAALPAATDACHGPPGPCAARKSRVMARRRFVWSNRAAMITFAADLDSRLHDLLASSVNEEEPGVALGIYRDGELVVHASAGLAVVEHTVPIGPDTAFDIASASKHFTATCLLLLEREGRLSLDADVRAYLPELALRDEVTLRQCLTHTGGLREYYSLCGLSGVPLAGMRGEPAAAVDQWTARCRLPARLCLLLLQHRLRPRGGDGPAGHWEVARRLCGRGALRAARHGIDKVP